ncbi:hypothetical protein [Thalassotalea sp. ND16A]|uniref:hypothetical protein n=1 Tax=Thalassotalea sp. ND16A TaxID=1535422 RepID=UPI00051A659E|nr:hypothetical protein [Thalassotalea sp. ND16A]KGJ97128.1 hypothetical protein ND16A_0050 [Thalassotalea sp. ND16A]
MLDSVATITFMISLLMIGAGYSRIELTKISSKEYRKTYNSSLTEKEKKLLIIGSILFLFSLAYGETIAI